MNNQSQEMSAQVAQLESKVDMLETELTYLNEILMQVGFTRGISTLKETVEETLLDNMQSVYHPSRVDE